MDQKIYVQIENKSLIPFFDLDKDSFRELNLTTIQDYQRTAVVTLYTRDAAGMDLRLKQYTIKPIPKAKAGVPKIGLSTRKRGYRRVDVELSLNGKQVITDRIRLPGAGRRLLLFLLILVFALLLGLGGYFLFTRLQTGSNSLSTAEVSRTPAVRRETTSPAPAPPPSRQTVPAAPAVEEQTPPRVSSPAAEDRETVETTAKEETGQAPAVPPSPLEQVLYFTPDSAVLTAETRAALNRLLPELRRYREAEITITGHCAPHGTEKGRQELSELRAEGVADYLRQNGIDVQPAHVRGIGAREPVTMQTEEQYLNRRVEIVIAAGE